MAKATIILAVLCLLAGESLGAYYVKLHQAPDFSCIILADEEISTYRGFSSKDANEVRVIFNPAVQGPGDSKQSFFSNIDGSKIIEIFARKQAVAQAQTEALCRQKEELQPLDTKSGALLAEPEILKIVDGGDQENRIDVVFMGDGYLESEREEFFDDIRRLTKDMFEGETFRSYLPLFNIWAIFEASEEQGIGYNGPKNTPFGLYRSQGQLRGIIPSNPGYARQVCRLTGTSGCEYPSIIGNDDFYGGLGGEFVISTRSNRTGTVVLRHEMGHNFADVGEEYDNGGVYDGVNSATSVSTLGWTSWLSGAAREERAIYRLLEYPWADLAKGSQNFSFTSDGTYSRWLLSVSVSAAGEEDSLEFLLDGEVLPWKTNGFDDREFYDWTGDQGFTPGQHSFSVRSKTPSTHPDIPRMICSVRLHEFGNEEEFHASNDYVSAYPTFDNYGRKVFRPTNAGCLMRNMTFTSFCPVCREGMWMQFLKRVSLIDSLEVASETNPDGTRDVSLSTLKLGHLRAPGNEVEGETLGVTWTLNGRVQSELKDQFNIRAEEGVWIVYVNLTTPEVRSDPNGLLSESKIFTA